MGVSLLELYAEAVPPAGPPRRRGCARPPAPSSRIDDITAGESGFRILAETDREIVVGTVGKVWAMQIPYVDVRPDEFAAFSAPGYAKVAWSLRVDPRDEGGA